MTLSTTIDTGALEGLIGQVRGVLAARVVVNEQQQIDEIHVVGSPERSAKQIVRDIESALFVRGGVRVNHRKISLVQLLESSIRPTVERVRLSAITRDEADGALTMTVSLGLGPREVAGRYRRPEGASVTPERCVALAALHAIDGLVSGSSGLELDQVLRQQLGRLEICIALVTRTEDDITESMIGVSIIRDDPLTAVVRAVLDAVNRRLPYLLERA